jgi:hypothetical protein
MAGRLGAAAAATGLAAAAAEGSTQGGGFLGFRSPPEPLARATREALLLVETL